MLGNATTWAFGTLKMVVSSEAVPNYYLYNFCSQPFRSLKYYHRYYCYFVCLVTSHLITKYVEKGARFHWYAVEVSTKSGCVSGSEA